MQNQTSVNMLIFSNCSAMRNSRKFQECQQQSHQLSLNNFSTNLANNQSIPAEYSTRRHLGQGFLAMCVTLLSGNTIFFAAIHVFDMNYVQRSHIFDT